MAYIDVVTALGPDYHCSFDNTITPEILNGTQVLSGTNPRKFTATAPAGLGTTYSVDLTKYATTPLVPILQNLPYTSDDGVTGGIDLGGAYKSQGWAVSFWMKFDHDVSATTLSSNYIFRHLRSSSSLYDTLSFFGGTINNTPSNTDRKINMGGFGYVVSDTQTGTMYGNATGQKKLSKGVWHHIAITFSWNRTATAGGTYQPDGYFERAIYVDGVLDFHAISGYTFNGLADGQIGTGNNLELLGTLGATQTYNDMHISHMSIFKKPLTRDQIRSLAWYGKSNSDYVGTVLAKSPVWLTTLDNTDKTTAAAALGTNGSTWGALSDDADGIAVNETSKFGKSWKVKHSNNGFNDGGQYKYTTTPELIQGFTDVQKTGEFTIELWAKVPYAALPTSPRGVMTVGSSTDTKNGYFKLTVLSAGSMSMSIPEKTGATTYTTNSVNTSYNYVSADTVAFANVQHTTGNKRYRMCDGEWHHYVVSMTKTKGGTGYVQKFYQDGRLAYEVILSTYGWIDGTANAYGWLVGNDTYSSSSNTNIDVWFDNIAIYDYALEDDQVVDNYVNGMLYTVPPSGAVKYYDGASWVTVQPKTWNGTAWVDWVKKYWDGTSWVDIL